MLVRFTWHSSASATRKAYSTAFWLTTGSTPGMPAHTGQTAMLGWVLVESTTAQAQNILEAVSNSAWTSRPMTGSYSMGGAQLSVAAHKALDAPQGFLDLLVPSGVGAAHKPLP